MLLDKVCGPEDGPSLTERYDAHVATLAEEVVAATRAVVPAPGPPSTDPGAGGPASGLAPEPETDPAVRAAAPQTTQPPATAPVVQGPRRAHPVYTALPILTGLLLGGTMWKLTAGDPALAFDVETGVQGWAEHARGGSLEPGRVSIPTAPRLRRSARCGIAA